MHRVILWQKRIMALAYCLLLCGVSVAEPTNHYLGLAVSNVLGPSYKLQHGRWSFVADAGWLTSFSGGYASVGGLYDLNLFQQDKATPEGGKFDLGLGFFAQDYVFSLAQGARAERMGYLTPFGMNALACFSIPINKQLPQWLFEVRVRLPIYFTGEDYVPLPPGWISIASYVQLVVLYKL